jgi:Tfp pilus assembly protein FimT
MRGFTIIEIIIVLGLTVALVAIGLPYYSAWQGGLFNQNDVVEIGEWLRTVQTRAEVGLNQVGHGLKLIPEEDKFVVYQGENYAQRIADYDQEVEMVDDMDFAYSNLDSDIHFIHMATSTRSNGSLTVKRGEREVGEININQASVVSWQVF